MNFDSKTRRPRAFGSVSRLDAAALQGRIGRAASAHQGTATPGHTFPVWSWDPKPSKGLRASNFTSRRFFCCYRHANKSSCHPSCPQQIVGELLSCSRRVARVEARLQPQRSESPNLGVFWANSNVRSASVQIAEWGRSLSICQPRLPVGVVPLSEEQSRVLMASAWTAWASGSWFIPGPDGPVQSLSSLAAISQPRPSGICIACKSVYRIVPMMSASRCSGCRVLHAIDQLLHAVDHWHTSPSLRQ